MSDIPDFSSEEIKVVEDTIAERFRRAVHVEQVTVELRVDKGDRELTECPALYWQVDDCHFVLATKGRNRFHCQFFYSVRDQYGTGIPEYDDILECVTSLLRVQADHEATRKNEQQDS